MITFVIYKSNDQRKKLHSINHIHHTYPVAILLYKSNLNHKKIHIIINIEATHHTISILPEISMFYFLYKYL